MSTRTERRTELSAFLRERRARLRPRDVGLPPGSRCRTPGLRREEVATLAGIGSSWYTWLEQGRRIGVTASVLDAVAGILRLDGTARAHLYRLAGHAAPRTRTASPDAAGQAHASPDVLPESVARVLEDRLPHPAYVLDRYWRFVGGNAAPGEVFGAPQPGQSCLNRFTGAVPGTRPPANWEELAPEPVAGFRAEAARHPDDPVFCRTVTELAARSPSFAELWRRQDVSDTALGTQVLDHPERGRMVFDRTTVRLADHCDLHITLLGPARRESDD